MIKIDFKKLISSFSIVSILVLMSLIFTKNTMNFYDNIIKPDIAPKAIVFPIVWTILYALIGVTLYRFINDKKIRSSIILNLVINVIWPILFFRFEMLFLSIMYYLLSSFLSYRHL